MLHDARSSADCIASDDEPHTLNDVVSRKKWTPVGRQIEFPMKINNLVYSPLWPGMDNMVLPRTSHH
ncbi:hypothetical protein H257_14777 [Aphanomyces astaci]|uniref:Uncharacterized protein n=1 Tax=Aphanomyces astaci TaxID=112090 RepID=W4FRG2_APHAT|nr:hypothetical protein H257_14777 [Aphanomyces astaci]ETV69541.1 hypothetical protein H257_14777 [Aphanomyces astaci]|eukprot:XP_009840965.1 hypothetical protein H257_14777 [Aphanomyces astaci]